MLVALPPFAGGAPSITVSLSCSHGYWISIGAARQCSFTAALHNANIRSWHFALARVQATDGHSDTGNVRPAAEQV